MKTKLLTTTTTTTAERIAQAKARHATRNYKPMIATTGDYTEIIPAVHDMTPAQLYHYPELCAYLVIRARHRETGLELFVQLATSAKRDATIMYDRTNRAEREMTTRKAYEQARHTAAELDRIAARITTDPDLAETAARWLETTAHRETTPEHTPMTWSRTTPGQHLSVLQWYKPQLYA